MKDPPSRYGLPRTVRKNPIKDKSAALKNCGVKPDEEGRAPEKRNNEGKRYGVGDAEISVATGKSKNQKRTI